MACRAHDARARIASAFTLFAHLALGALNIGAWILDALSVIAELTISAVQVRTRRLNAESISTGLASWAAYPGAAAHAGAVAAEAILRAFNVEAWVRDAVTRCAELTLRAACLLTMFFNTIARDAHCAGRALDIRA